MFLLLFKVSTQQYITIAQTGTNSTFIKSSNNSANTSSNGVSKLIDVNNNPVKLNNDFLRTSLARSPSDHNSLPSSSSHALRSSSQQPQSQQHRKFSYNDTLQRTSNIINSNQQNQMQLFQKINRLQQQQQQAGSTQQTSPLSSSNNNNNNTSTNASITDKRRISLLLARKS